MRNRRRFAKKKASLLFAVLLLFAMVAYELVSEQVDGKYAPTGELVAEYGHDMPIFSIGSGNTTVVFTSGWKVPSPYVDFYPLGNELSKRTRTVVYDRPGYGWSVVTDAPRDLEESDWPQELVGQQQTSCCERSRTCYPLVAPGIREQGDIGSRRN